MSLADAVLAVATEMETEAEKCVHTEDACLMRSFAKQLRLAVKASQGNFSPQTTVLPSQVMEDRAKQIRLRDQRIQAEQEEASRELMVLHGGKSDATMTPVQRNMPIGAKIIRDGEVYVLGEDGRLCFSQEDTYRFVDNDPMRA